MLAPTSQSLDLSHRNSRAGDRERHLLLYLQRIAAKDDTFSQFGPTGWGRIDNSVAGVKIDVRPGIAAREVYLERWTAHAAAAAMNNDPNVFAELSPRLNPNGHVVDGGFVFTDSGEKIELEAAEREIVERCDGRTPVHRSERQSKRFARWPEKIIKCEVEVPAL